MQAASPRRSPCSPAWSSCAPAMSLNTSRALCDREASTTVALCLLHCSPRPISMEGMAAGAVRGGMGGMLGQWSGLGSAVSRAAEQGLQMPTARPSAVYRGAASIHPSRAGAPTPPPALPCPPLTCKADLPEVWCVGGGVVPHPGEAVAGLQVPQQGCVDVVHAGGQVDVGQGGQLRQHALRGVVPQACGRTGEGRGAMGQWGR